MEKLDAAWLAGFFDGEGSYRRTPDKRRPSTSSYELCIGNTNLPALKHCQEITGVGRVVPLRSAGPRNKAYWQWRVTRRNDATEIRRQMAPFRRVLRRSEKSAPAPSTR